EPSPSFSDHETIGHLSGTMVEEQTFEEEQTDCQALYRAWLTMGTTTHAQADHLRRFENHDGCREMAKKPNEVKRSRDSFISLYERLEVKMKTLDKEHA
ncbi:hypothetical protein Tco_0346355, partial [Tanacetum coccineum]